MTRARFFSTTTALLRPWLKLCRTVDVSVRFRDSVLLPPDPPERPDRPSSSVSLIHTLCSYDGGSRGVAAGPPENPTHFQDLSGRKPESRSASKISRSAIRPGLRAACTTFALPRGKLNSGPE